MSTAILRSLRAPVQRIPHIRPLRPPNKLHSRVFSDGAVHKSRNLHAPRAQTSFLSAPGPFRNGIFTFRPMSTKSREKMKYQLRLIAFYTLNLALLAAAGVASYWGFRQCWLDQMYPSPPEWSYMTGVAWRQAHAELSKEKDGHDMTNWAGVGAWLSKVLEYCEVTESRLAINEDWDVTVPGIDRELIRREPVSKVNRFTKIGVDISEKSEPWRRAYFQTLMGYARAMEMNAGWVLDRSRGLCFPGNQVIGPSNPNPHPIWLGSPDPPLEENCIPCFDEPKEFYIRILTTRGFSPRQLLEAGLAYASWADFDGDKTTAQQLYEWSLKLACSALADEGTDPSSIVDSHTGVVKLEAPFVTSNILKASTALASFYARNLDLSAALSIYISVLRVRRAAPDATALQQYKPLGPDMSLQSLDSIIRFLKSTYRVPEMSPEPPSGNEPFMRTKGSNCDEAGVMAHVGEILFATSSKRAGLSWTRDSVALAEKGFKDSKLDPDSKRTCTECMSTGLENWHNMMGVLVEEESERKSESQSGWVAWLPSFTKSETAKLVDDGDWKQEAEMVSKKRTMFLEHRLMMTMNRKARPVW